MNLQVIRKDGTTYDLQSLGIKTLDFVVSSPEYRTVFEDVEGSDGAIDLGTTIAPRNLYASFYFEATDLLDYALLRNQIFNIFLSKESFYIIDEREPGKRWEVKCSSSFKPQQVLNKGLFDLDFTCSKGYAESIGTTSDPMTFDSGLWQIGQGLSADEMKYVHTTNTFKIFNAGDVVINPRKHFEFNIEYKGASNNLNILNETNGDKWVFNGASNSGDVIKLQGIRSTKNSLSIVRDTNKKLITLNTGWNNFKLSGTSGSFEIKFNFRFYYL